VSQKYLPQQLVVDVLLVFLLCDSFLDIQRVAFEAVLFGEN